MASGAVNGDGDDGIRDKKFHRVYKRKARGLKNNENISKFKNGSTKDSSQNVVAEEHPNPVIEDDTAEEAVAREDRDSAVVDKNLSETPPETPTQGVTPDLIDKKSIEAPSETPVGTSFKVHSQTPVERGADTFVVDKNSVGFPSVSLVEEHFDTVVADKNAIELPSESSVKEDVDSAVVDRKSEEAPANPPSQEVDTDVVDKHSVDSPPDDLGKDGADNDAQVNPLSHLEDMSSDVPFRNSIDTAPETGGQEHISTIVVDKQSIEVSVQEEANVVLCDINQFQAAQPLVSGASDLILSTKHMEFPVPDAVDSGGLMRNETSDDQIKLNLVSNSKKQKQELREKFESQLDMIRDLLRGIEAKEGEIRRYGNPRLLSGDGVNNVPDMFFSGLTSAGASHEVVRSSRPSHQLCVSVLENQGMSEHVEKEKRTPKANQFYRNSEFLLAKDKFPPAESNKKPKSNAKKQGGELGHGFGFGPDSKVYKNCGILLEKLMKHKHGWVFNAPVDVKGLGLHDYFTIIKHPMDLGTVKSKLTKNWYKLPREFAEDVRLTFYNAMTYNPEGQDVHIMAEQLLKIFEDKWFAIEADYNREMRFAYDNEVNFLTPRSRQAPMVRPPPINVLNLVDRSEHITRPFERQQKLIVTTPSGRTPALKKPKAHEPDKRDMTYEEKKKLSLNLQNLPLEKLDQIVHIVKKRNSAVSQRHDEIEVDIDSLDPETLWELDRFVTNYKKSLSKKKRRAEQAMQARAEAEKNIQEKNSKAITEELPRRDITTAKKNLSTSLPSQAQKQADNASRSSSSSGSSSDSSSSSSDSDSDTSSSSGSDQT